MLVKGPLASMVLNMVNEGSDDDGGGRRFGDGFVVCPFYWTVARCMLTTCEVLLRIIFVS